MQLDWNDKPFCTRLVTCNNTEMRNHYRHSNQCGAETFSSSSSSSSSSSKQQQ